MIVIADTSPLNYLVLIDCVDVLPKLYGRVVVPQAVYDELCDEKAPPAVRQWILSAPAWLEVKRAAGGPDTALRMLGPGERQAISLAEELHADAIILDDLPGRREAKRRNLHVIGTLTILYEAAGGGQLDFAAAVEKLVGAGFHASPRADSPLSGPARPPVRRKNGSLTAAPSFNSWSCRLAAASVGPPSASRTIELKV